MNDERTYVDAVFYAQVQPEWHPYTPDKLTNVKVRRVTQTRPEMTAGLVVKVTLRVPVSAFLSTVAVVAEPDATEVAAEVEQ